MPKPAPATGREYRCAERNPIVVELTINGQRVMQRRFSSKALTNMCSAPGSSTHVAASELHDQIIRDIREKMDLIRTLEIAMSPEQKNRVKKPK